MKIENLKQLKALIAICRRTGVESITVDGVELKLGSEPLKGQRKATNSPHLTAPDLADFGGIGTYDKIETPDFLDEEQLLNWSVGAEGEQ